MPYDFDFENENDTPVQKSRTSDILTSLGKLVDTKIMGETEKYPERFSMKSAWIWFIKMMMKCPEIEKCLIQVTKQEGRYMIVLLCCDGNEDPVYASEKSYYGKKLYAIHIDKDVVDFMGNQKTRTMDSGVLK